MLKKFSFCAIIRAQDNMGLSNVGGAGIMIEPTELLWKPLLEATAQTIAGAIGAYAIKEVTGRFFKDNTFESPMDLWKRGIHNHSIDIGDKIRLECLISPYTQLFPCDPFDNAKLWRKLYTFEGKVTAQEYQAMEFYVGADETLRVGSLNGETLVGLYYRYGYIGEGIIGVVSTTKLLKLIPNFFDKEFFGTRAVVTGTVELCPTQHGFVAQGIANKAGIDISSVDYKKLPYVNINSLKLINRDTARSLLATPWAVTDDPEAQYIIQYGYLDKPDEMVTCINNIQRAKAWENVRVFFDDLKAPSPDISFKKIFL